MSRDNKTNGNVIWINQMLKMLLFCL